MPGIPNCLKRKELWFLWVRRKFNGAGNSGDFLDYYSPLTKRKISFLNPVLSDYDAMARERAAEPIIDGGGIYVAGKLAVLVLRNCFAGEGDLLPWAIPIVNRFRS